MANEAVCPRSSNTFLRSLVRFGYPVVMLLGLNGLAIVLAPSGASKYWLLAVLGVAIALSFAAERVLPYEPAWNRPQGDVARDVAHFVVNELSNLVSIAALPFLSSLLPVRDEHWPHHWPFVLQVVASILVFDFGVTITHWASHRVPLLWRFHAVHHSVNRFYGFNGLMKHPVHQAVEMTVGIAPLLLLGLPLSVASALAVCTAIQLLMQHSNVDYSVGKLGGVLALNQGHRFHHLKWPRLGDVNFGLFTNIWDHLLGTWVSEPERRFNSADIGIEKQPDFPRTYLAQLASPFVRRE